jgi:hypothetical protein
VASALVVLALPAGVPGDQRDAAAQGNTVSIEVWTCPGTVETTNTDPAYLASTCVEPAVGLDFILTRDGRPSTRSTDADGSVRPWSAVAGPYTLRGELPNGETAVVFCSQNGDVEPVTVTDNTIDGDLAPGEEVTCSWFLVPPAATPTAEVIPPTNTPIPATTAPIPTVAAPTATATEPQVDPLATATAVQEAIAGTESTYFLGIPAGLQFPLDDRFRVYPQPGSRNEWSVDDFVVEAVFGNPSDDAGGGWDYGFLFGPSGSPEDYRLSVDSEGQWFLDLGSTTVLSGQVESLNLAAGESNKLRLIVIEGTGIFFVNDEYVATLDVAAAQDGGKLWLVSSFQGKPIQCRSLEVWPL